MRRQLAASALACGLASAALPSPARAANEAHVPTPVLWPSDCAVIVERSVDPIVHFDYAIPFEDTELTDDELPDSRTHQFVALCRDRALSDLLPTWITRDDVERSAALGLIEIADVEIAEILDESPAWSDCFVRITADDDRRPITFSQAAAGVDWDTSSASVGVWTVAAHTFEPPFNRWRDRPGFVKIVDDRDDPEQDLPALALLGSEQAVEPGASIELDACADVLGPATLELEWSEFAPQLDWRPLTTMSVTTDGPLTLAFSAPTEAAGRELLVRGRLIDALGRERVAYSPVRLTVAACDDQGCSEPRTEELDELASACTCAAPNERPIDARLLLLLGLPLVRARRRRPT